MTAEEREHALSLNFAQIFTEQPSFLPVKSSNTRALSLNTKHQEYTSVQNVGKRKDSKSILVMQDRNKPPSSGHSSSGASQLSRARSSVQLIKKD